MSKSSQPLHAEIERQRLLATSMRIGMVGMLAAIPLGAFWLAHLGPGNQAVLWAIMAAISTMLSGPLAERMLRARQDFRSARVTERFYAFKMLASGGLWGALAWAPAATDLDLLALGILQFLILVVSCVTLAVSRLAFPLLALSITLPLGARLITHPPEILPAAATGVIIAALVLVMAHHILFRTLRRVLLRRLQRDAVAQEQEALFHAASEGILLIREGVITKCNAQGAAMFGSHPELVVGTHVSEWLNEPEDWPQYLEDMRAAFRLGERFGAVIRMKSRTGESFFAELSANVIDSNKPEHGIVLVVTDISVRLATEAALRSSEQRFRRLLSLSSDWYWEQDANFRFTRITGTRNFSSPNDPLGHLIGRTRWELDTVDVSDPRWTSHRATLEAHLPFTDFVYQLRTEKGDVRWLSTTGHPLYDDAGRFSGYHGIGMDITESVRRQERYHHLAHHDTLTGLPNRRLLLDRLDQAIAHAKRHNHRVCVILLDLDNFKTINDTEGHSMGDLALITVAERLRDQLRESDTLCRLGGDEFVILLPEIAEPAAAEQVACKIISVFDNPIEVEGRRFNLGVSIGIAVYPDHTPSATSLLDLADAAMYQSKQTGGNQYCFAQIAEQGQLQLDTPA